MLIVYYHNTEGRPVLMPYTGDTCVVDILQRAANQYSRDIYVAGYGPSGEPVSAVCGFWLRGSIDIGWLRGEPPQLMQREAFVKNACQHLNAANLLLQRLT